MIIRIIVGVITIILTLIVIALLDGARGALERSSRYVLIQRRERQYANWRLSGVDEGYKKQVSQFFEIWVKDPHDQPARAKVGITNAINAYARARRDALAWAPAHC